MIEEKSIGSHDYLASIIDTVREPLLVLDGELRVVSASRYFYDFFKVKPEETVGQLIYDLGNKQWDIAKLRELLETILPEKTSFDDYEVEHDFASIGKRTMLLNARQIERESGKDRIILLAIEDITERRKMENLAAESEQRYRRIFETASDGIVLLEKQHGHIVQANAAAETMLGYSVDEYLGKDLRALGIPLDTSDFPQTMRSLAKQGILNYEYVPVKTSSGEDIYTDIYLVDRAKLAQCNIRDVSEQKRKEEDIERLNRTLLARSKSSKAMMRADDETGYLDEVCRIIVENCGHALVWVGYAEPDADKTVRPVTHAGLGEDYLDSTDFTWADTDRGQGPVGTAIRSGKVCVFQTIKEIPAGTSWRNEAAKWGFAAVISIPLLAKGKAFGSLNIYSRHQNPFSQDEMQLFVDLAADLSYGIAAIRLRAAQAEAESALRQSEERYRNLFDNMLEGVAYCKLLYRDDRPHDYTYLRVNKAFARLTGLQNVTGKNVSEVIPGIHETNPELLSVYGRVVSTGRPERFETWAESFGGWRDISVYSHEKDRFIAVFDNINARRQVEEEIRKEKAFSEAILESLPGIFFMFTFEGRFLRWNHTLETLSGYSAEEIAAMKPLDFFGGDDRMLIDESKIKMFETGTTTVEAAIISKDGRRTPHYFIGVHVDLTGIPCCVGMGIDITERKHLEAQLLHSQKMEAVGTLAGGIAHDFNNILNVVLGYGEMVMDGLQTGSPAREDMHEVLTAAKRAVDLTQGLLVFSRQQVVQMQQIDLNDLIRDVKKMLSQIVRESTDFKLDLTERPLPVLADAGQMELVLINLATNARDAMPEGGRLTIGTAIEGMDDGFVEAFGYGKPGRYAHITVADTGKGMDAETQKKIFEPFFTTKDVGEGTGLGLATSYGIVKQHGGYIKAYSEVGQGTVFKIYLPLCEKVESAAKEMEELDTVKRGSETILVVEDEDSLRKFLRITLSSFGYNVITAEDGDDAIKKFIENSGNIRLALLDMVMPKKNGKEVSKKMKKIQPGIKILFMSGYTMDVFKTQEIMKDGFDFLHKPFQAKALLHQVREILDR